MHPSQGFEPLVHVSPGNLLLRPHGDCDSLSRCHLSVSRAERARRSFRLAAPLFAFCRLCTRASLTDQPPNPNRPISTFISVTHPSRPLTFSAHPPRSSSNGQSHRSLHPTYLFASIHSVLPLPTPPLACVDARHSAGPPHRSLTLSESISPPPNPLNRSESILHRI